MMVSRAPFAGCVLFFLVFTAGYLKAAPLGVSDYVSVSSGGVVTIQVLANDGDTGSGIDRSSMYVVSPPMHGYVVYSNSTVTYHHYLGSGTTDRFSYSVADFQGSYTQPVQVEINVGNTTISPAGNDSSTVVANGGEVSINLLQGNANLNPGSLYIDKPAEHGYLSGLRGGRITYTHYAGSGTTDSFSYRAADWNGIYSAPIDVAVRVASGNYEPAPVAVTQNPAIAESTQVNTESSGWWTPRATDRLTWQLQLQGDLRLLDGIDVYAVDYTASQYSIDVARAGGAKVMCYISAGSVENWRPDYYDFPSQVIGNSYDGWPGEWWLDVRNIDALAPIMRARMDLCRSKGFDAIDADNINGFENNTGFGITREQSVAYIKWLANEAHRRGMAFSLKNAESLIPEVLSSVDMLQTESCYLYGNCANAALMTAANKPVFSVEYSEMISEQEFQNACYTANNYNFSMIYRNLSLTPYGQFRSCSQ